MYCNCIIVYYNFVCDLCISAYRQDKMELHGRTSL